MLAGAGGCAAQALFLAVVPMLLACELSQAPRCSHGRFRGCLAALPAVRGGSACPEGRMGHTRDACEQEGAGGTLTVMAAGEDAPPQVRGLAVRHFCEGR